MKNIFLYKREGKSIILTDIFAMVDDEDYDRISANRWYVMRLYHCETEILYARRYEWKKPKIKAILMHREILGATKRIHKVDHKDGNGLNNQKCNIRICTHSENMSNRKVSHKKKVKYLGVLLNKKNGKYRAAMKLNGIVYTSPFLETPELAAIAYNELIQKHKPNFGKLNLISCR